jgi:hypothetical protein
MFYVGLDIHDKRIAICVLGETGQVARRAQVRSIDEMMRVLEALPDRCEVCYGGQLRLQPLARPAQPDRLADHGGALRGRWCEWQKPHILSYNSEVTDDTQQMFIQLARLRSSEPIESFGSSLIDRPTLAAHHQCVRMREPAVRQHRTAKSCSGRGGSKRLFDPRRSEGLTPQLRSSTSTALRRSA